ncbi:hypothetical protein ASC94_31295 [Massilia sp. Root418]|jgi:hypothetical protein|uniref:hypothetical protein n=1 Tax=Massilia sp. Root418 TaxID=1736532 RepID=UPI0006FE9BD5|nr:hypothetical protein [Massilia sp. Root418]KQW97884.1 hypothetical protein ASC94_31295 [Massilia sp. Root418]
MFTLSQRDDLIHRDSSVTGADDHDCNEETLQIISYVGVEKINFGMSTAEARAILVGAEYSRRNRRGETVMTCKIAALTFSSAEEKLVEISFQPNVVLLASGIDIFNDEDALPRQHRSIGRLSISGYRSSNDQAYR